MAIDVSEVALRCKTFPVTLLLIFMSADLITNLHFFFHDSGINYFEYFLVYFCKVRVNISFIDRNVRRVERVQIKFIDLRGGKLENSGMQEGGKTCHKLHVLGMNDDLWDRAVITIIPLSLESLAVVKPAEEED